jgi:phosphate transport system substrate-binding protein
MKICIAIVAGVMLTGACSSLSCARMGGKAAHVEGDGSSSIAPLMQKWASEYEKTKGVKIEYTSCGSGNGIDHLIKGVNDFACTDFPLNAEQLRKARQVGGELVHIPLTLQAVVVVYNVEELQVSLRLTGPVLADIFLGKITRWNDPAIKELNAGAELPDKQILVAHRPDRSALTAIFTEYLASVSKEWKEKVGSGLEVRWPVGAASTLGAGPAQLIRLTPGAIGYLELAYVLADETKLKHAKIRNRDGKFVQGDLKSVTATAEGALPDIPDDLCFSLTNARGKDSYPICGTTWAVAFATQKGTRGQQLVELLTWALRDGQDFVADHGYARLPEGLARRGEERLRAIQTGH